MTAKKRARYEIKEKEKIINELDKNLLVKGPNVGKPNFYLVAKLYPQYKRKMLQYWYSKKDTILASSHKHKRFKLDNPNAKGEYPEMETLFDAYIMQLREKRKHEITRLFSSSQMDK